MLNCCVNVWVKCNVTKSMLSTFHYKTDKITNQKRNHLEQNVHFPKEKLSIIPFIKGRHAIFAQWLHIFFFSIRKYKFNWKLATTLENRSFEIGFWDIFVLLSIHFLNDWFHSLHVNGVSWTFNTEQISFKAFPKWKKHSNRK